MSVTLASEFPLSNFSNHLFVKLKLTINTLGLFSLGSVSPGMFNHLPDFDWLAVNTSYLEMILLKETECQHSWKGLPGTPF